GIDRRQFLGGVSVAAITAGSDRTGFAEASQGAAPRSGLLLHAADGQHIALSRGRDLTIQVDSHLTPDVRMSMVTEDLPPGVEIQVHLHEREDEIILIRAGSGVATLGDREVPVTAGAAIYAPQ